MAAIALVALVLAVASFVTQRPISGILDNAGPQDPGAVATPGGFEWAILAASAILFALAVLSLRHARGLAKAARAADSPRSGDVSAPALPETSDSTSAPSTPDAGPASVSALLRLLSHDERRLYSEIRGGGGSVYQKDLVARGTFSRAKVTRLLDKLEAKGLVARERHGMTNRIRILDETER